MNKVSVVINNIKDEEKRKRNREFYKEIKAAGDLLMTGKMAFIDSGFSDKEAFELASKILDDVFSH